MRFHVVKVVDEMHEDAIYTRSTVEADTIEEAARKVWAQGILDGELSDCAEVGDEDGGVWSVVEDGGYVFFYISESRTLAMEAAKAYEE